MELSSTISGMTWLAIPHETPGAHDVAPNRATEPAGRLGLIRD
jgi:hypothetical protein